MCYFRLLFSLITILALSSSLALAAPLFIIEEDGNKYVMYLQFDEIENIASIKVEGDFSKGKATSTMEVNMSAFDLKMLAGSKAAIHTLSSVYDSANYVVIVTDDQGKTYTYPSIAVTFSDGNGSLAIAN